MKRFLPLIFIIAVYALVAWLMLFRCYGQATTRPMTAAAAEIVAKVEAYDAASAAAVDAALKQKSLSDAAASAATQADALHRQQLAAATTQNTTLSLQLTAAEQQITGLQSVLDALRATTRPTTGPATKPAPPHLPPATQPTPTTTTRPAVSIGIGSIASAAGHPVYIGTATAWDADLQTSVIDPAGHIVDTQPGNNAIFPCDLAGAYTIQQTLAGATLQPITFLVPRANRQILSPPPGPLPAIPSHTELHLSAGTYGPIQVAHATDVIIYGAGADRTFIQSAGATPCWNSWSDTADVALHDCTCTSALVDGQPTGSFGTLRGSKNIALMNVREGDLVSGIKADSPIQGLYLSGLTTKSATCVQRQCVYIADARYVAFVHSKLDGCLLESPLRTTAPNGATDALFYDLEINQPPGGAKACSTDRTGLRQRWNHIRWANGDWSIETGGAEVNTQPTQIQYVYATNMSGAPGMIRIGPGASHVHVLGAVVANPGGEAISVQQSDGVRVPWRVTDISIRGVTMRPAAGSPPWKLYGPFVAGDVTVAN